MKSIKRKTRKTRKSRKSRKFNRKSKKYRKTGGSKLGPDLGSNGHNIYEVPSNFIKDTYDTDSKWDGTEILIKSKSDNKYYIKNPPFEVKMNIDSSKLSIRDVENKDIEINNGEFKYFINKEPLMCTYEVFISYRPPTRLEKIFGKKTTDEYDIFFGNRSTYYVKIEKVKRKDTLQVISSQSFYLSQPKDELEMIGTEILIQHNNIYYKKKDGLDPISVSENNNYIDINGKKYNIKSAPYFKYDIYENGNEKICQYSYFDKYSINGQIYYSKNMN